MRASMGAGVVLWQNGTGEAAFVAFTRARRPETTAHTQRARAVASALFKAA